jgi:tRNA uridine 5-carbamoylmethylation protein Kti12
MALITISGYPCSGKSRRAAQIKEHIERRIAGPDYTGPALSVTVLSDDTLNIGREAYNGESFPRGRMRTRVADPETLYKDSRSEKPARGTLFTAVQRHLGSGTIVIVDSLNYIKGFRYQMYCAARETKVRVCTVRTYISLIPIFQSSHRDLWEGCQLKTVLTEKRSRYMYSHHRSNAENGTRRAKITMYMHPKRKAFCGTLHLTTLIERSSFLQP